MKKIFFLLLVALGSLLQAQNAGLENEIKSIEQGLLPRLQIEGAETKPYTLESRMETLKVPGVSIAIIKEGKVRWAKGYGIADTSVGNKVDENTLFQAGSISKPLAALSILKLVEEGKIDLDTDVNQYLKEWKIPENDLTKTEKVTLRRLLTHSAGMTVHGFPGYSQEDDFPTDKEVLDGEGNTGPIRVDMVPGTRWRYSGGGYTVMEQLVEDISGKSLAQFSAEYIFPKMGMDNSTFMQPLPETMYAQASGAYDNKGMLIEGKWNNYPEQAAAGLWTTPTDLAKYCMEIQAIVAGKNSGVLSKETVDKMLTQHKNDWGLGPVVKNLGEDIAFGHGGKNAGFSNDMKAFTNRGEGVIIMTNADNGTVIMGEILRGVSSYYGWKFAETEKIKVMDLDAAALNGFAGTYSSKNIPEVENYEVEFTVKGNTLVLKDKTDGEITTFYPISKTEFREVEDGNYLAFRKNIKGKIVGFSYNSRFSFDKVE